MFQQLIDRIAKMGPVGVVVSAFVGGAFGHVLHSDLPAQAIARMAETAATGPVWKGAVAAGVLAAVLKATTNAKPQ